MRTHRSRARALLLAALVACVPVFSGDSLAGKGQSGTPNTASNTAEVDGSLGGVVRCGRWTVVIPPGAFSGVGQVTITVPDKSGTTCDLNIRPGGLNKFLVPVDLTFTTQGLNVDPTTLTIYWYDPTTGQWVDEHAVGDTGKQTVTAHLYHFSTYSVGALGKAGW